MTLIKEVRGHKPIFGANVFLAENATVVGEVQMGDHCSVWFNAVIRGDVHYIKIGDKVNIQDGAVIHCTYQKAATTIGNNVSIGHNALVHGCTIHDNVLIGMGAIVLNGAKIGSNCLIGAGALITENKTIPDGTLVVGAPGKIIRSLSGEEIMSLEQSALHYQQNAARFMADLKRIN